MIRASRTHWHLKKKSLNPYLQYIKGTVHKYELSAGGQSCHSHTQKKRKHCSKSMLWYLHMRHKDETARKMRAREGKKRRKEKQRDWQTHRLLYWTGVPLPWQPAALDWYLEQQVELLQRIWCSVHIWGQLIWRYNQLLLCSLHTHARNPLFETQRLAPDPAALKSLTECQINRQVRFIPTDVCAATYNVGLADVNRACVMLV